MPEIQKICLKCGKCCIYPDGTKCKFLTENNLCRIFKRRFEGMSLKNGYKCTFKAKCKNIDSLFYNELIPYKRG